MHATKTAGWRPFQSHKLNSDSFIPFCRNDVEHIQRIRLNSDFDLKVRFHQTSQSESHLVAEIIRINGQCFKPKATFITLLCNKIGKILVNKLKQIRFHGLLLNQPSDQYTMVNFNTIQPFFLSECLCQNKMLFIRFQQKPQNSYLFEPSQNYDIFIKLLEASADQIGKVLKQFGLLKKSYSERIKLARFQQSTSKSFKNIIKAKNKQQKMEKQSLLTIEKNCPIFKPLQIISQEDLIDFPIKRGGYFNVSKKKVKILQQDPLSGNTHIREQYLAQKALRKTKRLNTTFNYEGKNAKERQLLGHLNCLSQQSQQHFARYYQLKKNPQYFQQKDVNAMDEQQVQTKQTLSTCEDLSKGKKIQQDVIHMQYYDESLQQYMDSKSLLEMSEIIDFLKQILVTVKVLHSCGVVHRDLKPGNFILKKIQQGKLKTKLIDFGESTHQSYQYEPTSNLNLGFTIPYAPIECTVKGIAGFNKKQIDYWSIGVMIFQFVKGRIPITYSKCFKGDISQSWPTQLSFFEQQFCTNRQALIEKVLIISAHLFMKVQPTKRMKPQIGLHVIQLLENLVHELQLEKS